MADIVWNGGSGDWTDAQDWTPAQVPGSGDNASIAGTEASDVLVSAGETVTASGVVLDNSNATLEVDGVFDAGTITLEAGTLANYGTIADATLVLNGGTLTADEGVFSADTIQGGFEIGGSDTAIVQGGLTDESLDGTAPGTITIDGSFATLDFNDSETFDNATVLLGSADGFDTLQADGTLTLGSGVTVQTAGTILSDTLGGNGSIINQGTILADATTGTVAIDSDGFENDGVISVTGGDTLDIEPYGTFANDGTLTVGQGSTVAIQYVDGFTNTGAITVQAGGELDLDIAGAAGTQTTGGTVEVDGLLNAEGGTISIATDSAFATLLNYGTIADATLVLNGGTLTADEGVFSADTIQGGFEIDGSDTAIVQGGLTDESLDGTAPGTITIDGSFATLDFNDSETFDNATVLLGSADGFDTLQADGTLTLGSGVTVQTAGTILSDTLGGNGSIINQGTILADATTGTVAIDSDGFENDGVISVTGGDTLDIEPYGTFANDGTLTVGQGSTVAIQYVDGFTNTGAITVQAGGELDLDIAGAAGTQATGGTVEVDGLLNAEGGTISIATDSAFATLLNYGTIADATLVLNGGTLTADEGVFSADTIQGGFEIDGSDTAIVQGGLTDESLDGTAPGTITIDGSFATLDFNDSETFDNATVLLGSADGFDTLQADGTLTLGSGVTVQTAGTILSDTLGGNGSIINQGTILADATTGTVAIDSDGFENDGVISVTGGDTLDIEPYGTFANDGTLTVGQGSTVAIQYVDGFTNTGAIMVQGGTLTVGQSIDGNGGVINLSDDAVVTLDGVAAGQTVSFQDGSSLTITDPQGFAGTVAGFSAGDSITLQGVTDGQESYSDGLLTVTQAGTTVASIAFSGDYQPSDFTAEEVGGNLVLSTDVLPCFAGGTRILTDCGEVAVEDLPEGAQVVTVTDGRRQLSAVTWVGRRAVDITRHPAPEKVRPVRIAQGAFGDNLPARDLLLSPDHAVFAEGVLVPVKYLVNGCTVRFDATISRVVYFHVELTRHEVLLAEGLPAESYLETGGRAMFENAGQPMVLHPDFSPMVWDALGCAPVMVTGPEIEAIRVKLAARVDQVAAA